MTLPLVIFVVIFMGVIAGITFLAQFAPKEKGDKGERSETDPLSFPEKVSVWDPSDLEYIKEFENTSGGHYFFPFVNQQTDTVDLGLNGKNCQCSSVAACLITPEEMKALNAPLSPAFMAGALSLINGTPGSEDGVQEVLSGLGKKREMNWVELKPDDRDSWLAVPPGMAGLVRLSWRADPKKSDLSTLKVKMWTQFQKSRKGKNVDLAVQARFVPPFRTYSFPRPLALTKWDDAGKGEITFTVWSSTRTHFPLTAELLGHDPCFQVHVMPMDDADCLKAQKQINDDLRINMRQAPIRVLSAYHVKVTAWQTKGDKELELGRFQRWVDLRLGNKSISSFKVTGIVRGPVWFEKGEIDLGAFRLDEGSDPQKGRATLKTEPGVTIQEKPVEKKPHCLGVDLKKVGPNLWRLTVTAPPNPPIVAWPDDSAIVLKAEQKGKPPRRVRIPVVAVPYKK